MGIKHISCDIKKTVNLLRKKLVVKHKDGQLQVRTVLELNVLQVNLNQTLRKDPRKGKQRELREIYGLSEDSLKNISQVDLIWKDEPTMSEDLRVI